MISIKGLVNDLELARSLPACLPDEIIKLLFLGLVLF